jgi:hypothetical protein
MVIDPHYLPAACNGIGKYLHTLFNKLVVETKVCDYDDSPIVRVVGCRMDEVAHLAHIVRAVTQEYRHGLRVPN